MNNKKAKKTIKTILISLVCIILAGVIFIAGAQVMFYPHYKNSERSFSITNNSRSENITVMSCNVRTVSPFDMFKKSWFYRADLIIKNIEAQSPDIIGFQEVTRFHYDYLTNCLEGYENVLTYRDGSYFSEGCPIFYNTSKFQLIDKGSFWLSSTPDEMSRDWGAACYRICSFVVLKQLSDGKELAVFNTHLDHISEKARINGIRLILEKLNAFGDYPCVIMGDFNAEESSETYKAAAKLFDDAKYKAGITMSGATYQNYGKSLNRENIDYFMVSKTGIDVSEYKIVDTTYDGIYPSDHFPIVIKIALS
ncbi:MAG: endonuclease/exonuclease/phosphatase family protein [Oscillospiraceae bacterium]|nr:endonuclease/exonuclease/phosphatase family protein [Oscillospiraceae bacterium]